MKNRVQFVCKIFAAIALISISNQTIAQSVKFPNNTITAKAGRPIFVNPIIDGDDVYWDIPGGLDDWVGLLPKEVGDKFGNAKIFYGDPGTYTLKALTSKVVNGKAKLSPLVTLTIVIEGILPQPPVPVPDPPGPKPQPAAVTPIPEPGNRVLVIYDAMANNGAESPIYSQAIRDYLNSKCITGQDGKTKEWRIWDKSATSTIPLWSAALARPRQGSPWIIISKGGTLGGFEGPLPQSPEATLTLLKKYFD